jgi:DNA-directed RNA polymerase specialized sigma24 family protein
VIGNHYRKVRRRDEISGTKGSGHGEIERTAHGASPLTPLEMMERDEVQAAINEALTALEQEDDTCAGHLSRLAAGVKPMTLAEEDGIAASVMYRRLYRCRRKLARLLEERGITP